MTEALRIELEMPQAHFRKPWSYKIRHTYPIPPFSTVIGLLCNILGDPELLFKDDFGLSVFSQFSSIDSSYIWLRNLKPKAHVNKYLNPQNRELRANNIEHPGGQSPVKCFVLNDVHILLYLVSDNIDIFSAIETGIKRPDKWFSHLHLGRSEDWVVLKEMKQIKIEPMEFAGKSDYLSWIPSPNENYHADEFPQYERTYETLNGRSMLIPAKYEIVVIDQTPLRNFEWKKVKILESQNYPITFTSHRFRYFVDDEKDLPLIFTRITKTEKSGDV